MNKYKVTIKTNLTEENLKVFLSKLGRVVFALSEYDPKRNITQNKDKNSNPIVYNNSTSFNKNRLNQVL